MAAKTLSSSFVEAESVVLRKAQVNDLEGLIEIHTDPEVREFLGGPKSRELLEARLAEVGVEGSTAAAGAFVLADKTTNEFLGIISLLPKPHANDEQEGVNTEELELGYVLKRASWGSGIAFQAAIALLGAAAKELPSQPVNLITQTLNVRSIDLAHRLGFTPVKVFDEYGASQTLMTANLDDFLS